MHMLTLGEGIVEAVVEESEVEVSVGFVHGCDEHPGGRIGKKHLYKCLGTMKSSSAVYMYNVVMYYVGGEEMYMYTNM